MSADPSSTPSSNSNQIRNSALKGAIIGIGVGVVLAGLSIAFSLWRRRRLLQRRRFETNFGPTPFLVRPLVPVHNPGQPHVPSTRRAEARPVRVARVPDAKKKPVDLHALQEIPRALTASPRRTANDTRGNRGEKHIIPRGTQVVPQAHIPMA